MAETQEPSATTERQKVMNPRVEIDTSPPFESVKEAVDWFGGSGPWIPLHLLRLAAAGHALQHEIGAFNVEKIEEQAAQLERDLLKKEQETRNILKELEAAKNFVERIKTTLMPASSLIASPDINLGNHVAVPDENSIEDLSLCPLLSPGLMFMELNQAKLNLSKTSVDLALIQASVESLNQKMQREKLLLEQRSKMQLPSSEGMLSLEQNNSISRNKPVLDQKVEMADNPDISMSLCKDLTKVNFEAEQFKKMTEASRYEVIKAMAEIERTKNSIKMAEMRLYAAKKMEEAAKAVEAIALAQGNVLNGCKDSSDVFSPKSDGITLSFEEYQALTRKAQQAEDLCKTKFVDMNAIQQTNDAHQLDVPVLEKFEEIARENTKSCQAEGPRRANVTANLVQQPENNSNKFKFRNSHPGHRSTHAPNENEQHRMEDQSGLGSPPMTSLGDILSRKFMLQDDVMAGRQVDNRSGRQHISLSQMLREQSRLILHSPKRTADNATVEKQYFVQRKKFGFINVPLPTKQSKKKTHPLNVR